MSITLILKISSKHIRRMSQTLPLVVGLAGAYYLYTNMSNTLPETAPPISEPPTSTAPNPFIQTEGGTDPLLEAGTTNNGCDEGYIYNSTDNTCEPSQELLDKACGKNYRYDKTKATCVLAGQLGCPKGLNRVAKPTPENPDGFDCIDPTEYKRDDSKDVLKTGNAKADIAVNVFTNIGAGMVIDFGLERAGKAITNNLLTTAAERQAKELAEKAAKEAAEKLVAEAAEKASKEAIEKAATKAAQEAAEKVAKLAAGKAAVIAKQAAKTAAVAAKAGKGASLLTKIKGTPFSFIITIIATVLSAVLNLDPEEFEACKPGEFDYSTLPDWAKVLIEAVPFVGDLLMLIGPVMCMGKGCKETEEEEQSGLCYKKPLPGFWCDSFLCYAQDDPLAIDRPGFTNNGQLHTTTHMTKDIRSDLGRPRLEVGVCPPGTRKDSAGALCYPDVPDNWNIVWGVAWEGCNADERDDGAFCAKETINPCAEGQWEVGRDCWGNRQDCVVDCITKPASGGGCRRWGHCPDLLGTNWCAGICDEWEPIKGCGTTCWDIPELKTTFAARSWGFTTRAKSSRALAGTERELECPPGMEKMAGWNETCYDKSQWPPGYQMQSAGLISQICPRVSDSSPARQQKEFNDFEDIGVSCQRGRYNRGVGTPAISMYIKKRREQPPNLPPPLCKDKEGVISDPDNLLLCMNEGCADDEKPNADYSLCEQQCRPLYKDEGEFCTRPANITDPITGQIYQTEDSYEKRKPREISFGVY
jgi:hypothetical protein